MMWMVRLALRRPYTFVVSALLIVILGVYSILTMATDIFPEINIPVVTVLWMYNGLSAQQIADRIVTNSERVLTTSVSDIEHIESQSFNGVGVIKVFLQPTANVGAAIAQISATSQVMVRTLPPGTTPPFIIQYNASSVPILQLGLSGKGMTEQQLFDLSTQSIRTTMATVEGAQTPYPYGGKSRQIMVDLDLHALEAKGLSPSDVVNAVGSQNLIVPSGTMKIGNYEYAIETNSAPELAAALNDLPIKAANGAMTYVRDVAHVRDGAAPQTNIVRVNGQRSVMISVMKTGSASTLKIIAEIQQKLKAMKDRLPPQLRIEQLLDQSIFVRAAIAGVVREAVIAACLTAIMVLMFLGSLRSTVIIAVSIPLSILCSLIALALLHQTINLMTLGGLALAVGILVDDATVAIENINRNLEMGKAIEPAILDGAAEIATPALVSTLSICIVFAPMFFLKGVPKYLFVPMAEAVIFAMLASYVLSRTLVPTMAKYMLRPHEENEAELRSGSRNPFLRYQAAFDRGFNRFRLGYLRLLTLCVDHAKVFLVLFLVFAVGSVAWLLPSLGEDFFPAVDSGAFKIHLRARTGTRLEETAALCDRVDATIRETVPAKELASIVDNIGLPNSSLNLSYSTSAPIGPADADIQVQLAADHHSSDEYVGKLRAKLAERFPGVAFYMLPIDMVTQILNFGLSAPVDLQIVGPNLAANRILAERMLDEMRYAPGVADARIQQPFDLPRLTVNVDRTRAGMVGLTQQNVAQSLLVALSGSFQTTPNFYLDPKNGATYNVTTMTPQYSMDSLEALKGLPVSNTSAASAALANSAPTSAPGARRQSEVLGNLAQVTPGTEMGTVSHYDILPTIDVLANVSGADLGSVTGRIEEIIARHQRDLPRGSVFTLRGQSSTMRSSYTGLLAGLAFSILLVYLLIVVNFQSWLDPFLIISALPAALAGIAWMLFLTGTRLSVPALTGAIMCMGVSAANSILVVNYAREQLTELSGDARQSALNAGFVRLRPVLMTALAMMIGMLPMALGLGEGGEQNAPLGRAVIGGLLLATVSTLFFVPAFFSAVYNWMARRRQRAAFDATLES